MQRRARENPKAVARIFDQIPDEAHAPRVTNFFFQLLDAAHFPQRRRARCRRRRAGGNFFGDLLLEVETQLFIELLVHAISLE